MNKKNKKEKRKNIYAKAPVRKRNKFYLTFSHGILFINNTLAFSQWKLWQLNLKENCIRFWKRKAKQFQCKPRHELLNSTFKNIPIIWPFVVEFSFFLNTNINNVGLCRLSVSIYLSPIGNFFQHFVGSQLYFSPLSQVD